MPSFTQKWRHDTDKGVRSSGMPSLLVLWTNSRMPKKYGFIRLKFKNQAVYSRNFLPKPLKKLAWVWLEDNFSFWCDYWRIWPKYVYIFWFQNPSLKVIRCNDKKIMKWCIVIWAHMYVKIHKVCFRQKRWPPQICIPSANPVKDDEITDCDFNPWMSDFNAQKYLESSTL